MDTQGNVLARVTDPLEPEELLEIVRPAGRRIAATTDQANKP
jgi:hypothetical protein